MAKFFGKKPPQNMDSEAAVLGAVLIEKNAISTAVRLLKPECFYTEKHQLIFQAMMSLHNTGRSIDLITVAEELVKMDAMVRIGGAYELTKLTLHVVSSAHLEDHCMIVLHKYLLRELGRQFMTAFNETNMASADPNEIMGRISKEILRLQGMISGRSFVELSQTLVEVLQDLMNNQEDAKGGCEFVHSSLKMLIPSIRAGDLVILAARPSVGKTAFALEFAMGEVLKGKSVAFFSMEMSREQLVQRITSAVSGVPFAAVYNREMSDAQMRKFYAGAQRIASTKLFIDDSYNNSFRELEAKAMNLKITQGLDLLIIDYLQLIGTDEGRRSNTRQDDISAISRGCKGLAKALAVPVVALSQMSRAIETTGRKEPRLSDLRESGAIEQDADIVMFLYKDEDAQVEVNFGDPVKLWMKVAKHRNGALGQIRLTFDGNYMKFSE